MKESWNWDRLPASFLDSAYLNIDNDAVSSHLNPKSTSSLCSVSQLDVPEGCNEPASFGDIEIMDTGNEAISATATNIPAT